MRSRADRLDAPRRKSDPAELQVTSRRQAGDLIRVGPETLRGWVEQEERNAGAGPSLSDEASAEVRQPRKENSELKRAVASTFSCVKLRRIPCLWMLRRHRGAVRGGRRQTIVA